MPVANFLQVVDSSRAGGINVDKEHSGPPQAFYLTPDDFTLPNEKTSWDKTHHQFLSRHVTILKCCVEETAFVKFVSKHYHGDYPNAWKTALKRDDYVP